MQLDCPSFLSHSNSVVTATYLARYPFRIVLGLTHDHGLPCILLLSNQRTPILVRAFQSGFEPESYGPKPHVLHVAPSENIFLTSAIGSPSAKRICLIKKAVQIIKSTPP